MSKVIVDEDNVVIVSRDGWVKGQKEVKGRRRDAPARGGLGDGGAAGQYEGVGGVFSNFGVAYTSRIAEIPASTGYGEPIQRFYKLKDGEKIVGAMSLDERRAPAGGLRVCPRRLRSWASSASPAARS